MSVRTKIPLRRLMWLLVIGLLLYLVAAGVTGLGTSLAAIRSADPGAIGLALTAIIASYCFAAATYCFLAQKKLRYGPTLLVQVAGGLVNRLLPAGIGGLGINTLYLKKCGHNLPVAAAIVAMNNFMGLLGNVLLVVAALAINPFSMPSIHLAVSSVLAGVFGLCFLAGIGVVVLRRYGVLADWRRSKRQLRQYFLTYRRRPWRLILALGSSMLLTACHATGLFFVLQAFGIDGPWTVALLAVSLGSLAGGLVPSPGGLGGAEAGISAVLVAYGLPLSEATLAALAYRGLTYWLPLLPGFLALRIVEKRYLR